MNSFQSFGLDAWVFISVYLGSLILVGFAGYKARKENTLKDFYLGGNGFGLIVIFLTLYATQYSGNTLFGYSGKTYRIGYAWVMSAHFMTAIVSCFMILLFMLFKQFGPISLATAAIQQMPDSIKADVPDANRLREWLSYIIIIGLGSVLYEL